MRLAPKPDPVTGLPRPPHAPVEGDWRPTDRETPQRAKVPKPPEGGSPTLEWFQTSRPNKLVPGLIGVVVMLAFFCIRDTGFDWMRTWWLWIFVVIPVPIFYLIMRDPMSAGADWFNYNGSFVRTYELSSVQISYGGAATYLDLEDSGERTVSVQLHVVQQNRALWDLVYNGILHSVHRGRAATNRDALDRLHLMDASR